MEYQLCASANSYFKLQNYGNQSQNTSFRVFDSGNQFVQMSSLTLNCTIEIFHHKTRFFKCFSVQNLICASVNSNLKLHIFSILPKNVFSWDLKWKISFVQVPTLTLNCKNAITHYKTRLFDCFTVEKLICATVNSNFKLHKCNIPQQNTSFLVFCSWKSDLCKCQHCFEIAQMRSSIAKHVLFWFYCGKSALCKCQLWP